MHVPLLVEVQGNILGFVIGEPAPAKLVDLVRFAALAEHPDEVNGLALVDRLVDQTIETLVEAVHLTLGERALGADPRLAEIAAAGTNWLLAACEDYAAASLWATGARSARAPLSELAVVLVDRVARWVPVVSVTEARARLHPLAPRWKITLGVVLAVARHPGIAGDDVAAVVRSLSVDRLPATDA